MLAIQEEIDKAFIYPAYKPSNIDWIGDIPEHWEIKKLKYFAQIMNGKDYQEFVLEEGGYPVYGSGGPFARCSKFLHDKPSVLLGRKGSVSNPQLVFEPFWTSDTIYYTNIKSDVEPKFLFHLTKQIQFDLYIYGSAVPSMTKSVYDDMLFPYPPFPEQQAIVNYLDQKTALIDELIGKKQRKIDLLKEQRTAIINHAVTKGLNPDVKLKASSEKWLGDYPSHWQCVNFGVVCRLQQGLQIPFEDRFFEYTEGCYEYITTQSIHNPNQPKQYIKSPKKSVICYPNDIIYGRTGNTGEVVTNVHGVFHNNFFKIDYNQAKIVKDYLVAYLTNLRFREHILLLAGTTTIPDLNHGSFFSTRFLLPPLEEQQAIVTYLDEQTALIDKAIALEVQKIEKLKEYRQSLISAAVTGKICVVPFTEREEPKAV